MVNNSKRKEKIPQLPIKAKSPEISLGSSAVTVYSTSNEFIKELKRVSKKRGIIPLKETVDEK